MREGSEFNTISSGAAKKFLYSVPITSKGDKPDNDQWSFASKARTTSHNTPRAVQVDLDNVWSIRNVGLAAGNKSLLSDLTAIKGDGKNAGKAFYSRHCGIKGWSNSSHNRPANTNTSGEGVNWTSTGHNFAQGVRLNNPPPTFEDPSVLSSQQHHQTPSHFDHDHREFQC